MNRVAVTDSDTNVIQGIHDQVKLLEERHVELGAATRQRNIIKTLL